jgi:hypothetical protein
LKPLNPKEVAVEITCAVIIIQEYNAIAPHGKCSKQKTKTNYSFWLPAFLGEDEEVKSYIRI